MISATLAAAVDKITHSNMNIRSFYLYLLCFLFCTLSTPSAGQITNGNRGSHCGADFKWNEGLKGVKLLDDCMLLKDDLILKDSVMQITDRTECINSFYLVIGGFEMETKWKTTGSPLTSGEIKFKNGLPQELRKIPIRAIFTAKNNRRVRMPFISYIDLDPTKCSEEERDPPVNDVDESANDQEDTVPNKIGVLPIIAGVGSIILLVAVGALVMWKKKRGNGPIEVIKTEENDVYGIYSRGPGGEGDYGDGDKVYVTDSNDYYAS